MTKKELVDAFAKESKLSKIDSEKAVNSFVHVVSSALQKYDVILWGAEIIYLSYLLEKAEQSWFIFTKK